MKEDIFICICVYISADIDECLLDMYDCPSNNSNCVNVLGGYKCVCNQGYIQNGSHCCKSFNACVCTYIKL